ncbi:hypothetical protein [Paenibacillus polymyxa]|uniref:hypothetical protein n=1 Tax=Paenibacillus polymyxa TaxID=1406 RepID=UPI00287F4C42|nr:hypothetical protein [Paenibacillus polymyxa]
MEVINLKGYSGYNTYWTDLSFDDSRVLFTQKKENEIRGFPIESVICHHLHNNVTENFELPQTNVFTLSSTSSSATLYYADYSNTTDDILFYKLDCRRLESQYIFKLNINELFGNTLQVRDLEGIISFLCSHINIIGIDDRYMILNYEVEQGNYKVQKHWNIIDSMYGAMTTFPPEALMDHIQTINLWCNNDVTYLIFKTGQYSAKEKEYKWKNKYSEVSSEKGLIEEELIIIDSEKFIDHIRKGELPLKKYSIASCTEKSALMSYSYLQNKIVYFKHLFEIDSTSITSYNPSDSSEEKIIIKELHSRIFTCGNKYYSFRDCYFNEHEELTIIDLLSNKIVFQEESKERFLCGTNQAIFTYIYLDNGNLRVSSRDYNKRGEKVVGEGRVVFVDQQRHCILIIE